MPSGKGWRLLGEPEENIVHVSPENDWFEHTVSADCGCKPKIDSEAQILDEEHNDLDGEAYIHNAWDCREHYELDHDKTDCDYCAFRVELEIRKHMRKFNGGERYDETE